MRARIPAPRKDPETGEILSDGSLRHLQIAVEDSEVLGLAVLKEIQRLDLRIDHLQGAPSPSCFAKAESSRGMDATAQLRFRLRPSAQDQFEAAL